MCRKRSLFAAIVGIVLLGAAVTSGTAFVSPLQDRQAPELASTAWINSPPLRLQELHGKVVLLEFWTYG